MKLPFRRLTKPFRATLVPLLALALLGPSSCRLSENGLGSAQDEPGEEPDAGTGVGGAGGTQGGVGGGTAGGEGGAAGGAGGTSTGGTGTGGTGTGGTGTGGTGLLGGMGGITPPPPKPDGQPCENGAECQGGTCTAKVCTTPIGKRPNGQACGGNDVCTSNSCVDGICCESACAGACFSCKLSGQLGMCRPVPQGQTPARNECPPQDASTCGLTGVCDGAGACAKHAEGVMCGAPACSPGGAVSYSCKQGQCAATAPAACGVYQCRDAACLTRCETGVDCAANLQCVAGACVPAGAATIPFAPSPPKIDGVVDSVADGVWGGVAGGNIIDTLVKGTVSPGTADLWGGWKMLWDTQALYVAVLVRDSILSADSTSAFPWQDDSVEVYLDPDYSRGARYDGRNDSQYVFGWRATGSPWIVEVSASRTQNVSAAALAIPGGYVMEIRVPWATLGVQPRAGQSIGVDVHLNDDDNSRDREGKKAWFATQDNLWERPDAMGTAVLLAP